MEIADVVRRIKGTITKESPAQELPQKNIRFPLSPWQYLRPDVKTGPLKDAIGGSGGESLFNAFADGAVATGDKLYLTYLVQNPQGQNTSVSHDVYYIEPQEPLFDKKGKDPHRPRHLFYFLRERKIQGMSSILTWTKFISNEEAPENVQKAIEDYRTSRKVQMRK